MNNDILTADLKEYVDSIIEHFEELEIPASITVYIETEKKHIVTASLRRGDMGSIVTNTVIKNISHLINNLDFMYALQKAIMDK